jgi:peptidoglycan hydrolase-like protein with peptidoglycan-binding domain
LSSVVGRAQGKVAALRSTTELRKLWGPPCDFTKRTLTLYTGATLSGLNAEVYEAFQALDAIMRSTNYVPRANTSKAWETGAYNCRKITNGRGYSLHAYGIAADINARTNPYGPKLVTDMPFAMVSAIKAIRNKKGLQVFGWGGDYRRNKDAMHYEVVLSPAEIKAGIDWSTVSAEPTNPNDSNTWPKLEKGDKGPSVAKLHELLVNAGFKDVDQGSGFKSKTQTAVRAFQTSRKLEIDGVVGLQTWTALLNGLPAVGEDQPSPFKVDKVEPPDRPTVKKGSKGAVVEELQRRLADKGFSPGSVDGVFGKRTTTALIAFQKANGLEADSVCGPKTWRALLI